MKYKKEKETHLGKIIEYRKYCKNCKHYYETQILVNRKEKKIKNASRCRKWRLRTNIPHVVTSSTSYPSVDEFLLSLKPCKFFRPDIFWIKKRIKK